MSKLRYLFSVSLDGYIVDANGNFDWAEPDREVHEFYNDQAREIGSLLYGRRLYELMNAHWPTADQEPDNPPHVVDFAKIWQATPKVVFSTTLDAVGGNARLVKDNAVDEVRRLKERPARTSRSAAPASRRP